MELVDGVVTFLIGIVWLAGKVGKLILKVARVAKSWLAAHNAQRAAQPAAQAATGTRTAAMSTAAAAPAGAPASTAKTAPAPTGARVKGHQPSSPRFEVADRILLVKFGGGWSVTVRVYEQRGVAQRLLRCTEPQMVEQLKYTFLQSVFPLKDVSLKDYSLEEVLRDCEVAGATKAAELLRRLGDPQVHPLRDLVEATQSAPQVPAPAAVAATPLATEPLPEAPQPKATPRPAAGGGRSVQGRVVTAGKQASVTGGGATFEVVLETDGGEQEIKKGWHLSEVFTKLGVGVGDNVRITDLGRQAIEPGANGQQRFKSMYDVQRV